MISSQFSYHLFSVAHICGNFTNSFFNPLNKIWVGCRWHARFYIWISWINNFTIFNFLGFFSRSWKEASHWRSNDWSFLFYFINVLLWLVLISLQKFLGFLFFPLFHFFCFLNQLLLKWVEFLLLTCLLFILFFLFFRFRLIFIIVILIRKLRINIFH